METLRIKNASASFANFCVSLDIRFAYSYGVFYVFGTSEPGKFRNFCKKNGFAKWESIEITACEFENEF